MMVSLEIAASTVDKLRLLARANAYRCIADYHAKQLDLTADLRMCGMNGRKWNERVDRLASFHGKLQAKYEYAASKPRLPVEPDPPEPE
jgi:hypothetical protein